VNIFLFYIWSGSILIRRHVFQHSYNVWSDPEFVDRNGNPLCDSCLSHKKPTQEEHHLHDFNPQSTSLVWRVACIVQIRSTSFQVQLLDRYSDWARGKKVEYVSEVKTLNNILRMTSTDQVETATTHQRPPPDLPHQHSWPRPRHARTPFPKPTQRHLNT
jgi:hypothetical protein